jgi:hypothetical protein
VTGGPETGMHALGVAIPIALTAAVEWGYDGYLISGRLYG